ncbi:MAG: hypothetical protein NTX82_03980 [Candidatus Parcubacteria bacterium]|nr:hypothetical protein [Candidatus Parcubacteria bacterium]
MNNSDPTPKSEGIDGFLQKIAVEFKDAKVRCNNCQYEGLATESNNGCPKCGEKSNFTLIASSGKKFEASALKPTVKIQHNWMILLSVIILYIFYKMLNLKYFLAVLILVIVVDLIIIARRKENI